MVFLWLQDTEVYRFYTSCHNIYMTEDQHAVKQLYVIRKINAKLMSSFIYSRSEVVTVVLKALCVI